MSQHSSFARYRKQFNESGRIELHHRQLYFVTGLPGSQLQEMVIFENGSLGYIWQLNADSVVVVPLDTQALEVGMAVARTGQRLGIDLSKLKSQQLYSGLLDLTATDLENDKLKLESIDTTPPGLESRAVVDQPLVTGLTTIDSLIPLGHGQRELIIGDRTTGKSATALQAMLYQASQGTLGVYAMIGQRRRDIEHVVNQVQQSKYKDKIVVIASTADDSPGIITATPFTAMTLAEHLRDQGKNVLVVLDDLSAHAQSYRQLSLTAGRFPGKDSYPGDIFHLHARLLERAGNFKLKGDQASAISVLPIATAAGGSLTGYITTNLMSITDGHLYFDTEMFFKGARPAVDPFLSVSRVGRQTRSTIGHILVQEAIEVLTKYQQAQDFARFGSEVSETVLDHINRGERLSELLIQPLNQPVSMDIQALMVALILTTDRSVEQVKQSADKVAQNKELSAWLNQTLAEAESLEQLQKQLSEAKI